ncbi:replication protein [Candidatus Fukatsuia endosymbiont of Tuberolachnus salignus]|uniref:replication protein n=1 Tax=Candidatus Fukatsuia endosymbiont of Tuberolachnus salignus TaxID=3077957 RepID=UPI00313D7F53
MSMSQAGQGNDRAIDRQEQRVANIDEGYTRLANELYEELIGANLTRTQAKVVHAVCRKTYGFHKSMDRITDSQLADLCRITRPKANVVKNELIKMRVLLSEGKKMGLNKNLSEWIIANCSQIENTVPKTGTIKNVSNTITESVLKTITKVFPIREHTKETITKKRKEIITPLSPFGDERVKMVFAFWQKNLVHPQARLDKKRAKRIQARLKEKFSAEDLCQAITGATYDPWLMGKNPENKRYDGIDTVLRDAAQVERLMGLAGNHYAKALAHGKYSATTARNIQNLQSWISSNENTGAPF